MHNSVKLNTPCEMINVTPINPLISKCQIKVCYVGDEPNRNKSIITKDVAREMANSLPGSPIVGYFNQERGDFEKHNKQISISNGKFELVDGTRPYGFVDLGAKAWFQKFSDEGVEREYLMTEGYLWTGQYPETKRIIDRGNNQSMELDKQTLNAYWTEDKNNKPEFFIINEAIISKLCILGEDVEPCFEGSQITKVQFSFEDDFKEQLFSLMEEMKEILNEGGTSKMTEDIKVDELDTEEKAIEEEVVETPVDTEGTTDDDTEFKKKDDEEEEEEKKDDDTSDDASKDDDKKDEGSSDDKTDDSEDDDEEDKKKKDKKVKYELEEIEEYVELSERYDELKARYDELTALKEALASENEELRTFKSTKEREDKQAMIDNFYMLSDEDKKDVIDNIDSYSLDDIEAKLSVICVRNKVSFNVEEEKKDNTTYNLNGADYNNDDLPEWIKAVKNVANQMN